MGSHAKHMQNPEQTGDCSSQISCFYVAGILRNTGTIFCPHFKIGVEEGDEQISLKIYSEDCSSEWAHGIPVNVNTTVLPNRFWLDTETRFAAMQFLDVQDEQNPSGKNFLFLSLQTGDCMRDKNIVDYFESVCKKFESMGVGNRKRDMSSLYRNMEEGVFWHQKALWFSLFEKQEMREMMKTEGGLVEEVEVDEYDEAMNMTVSMTMKIGRGD